MVFKEYKSEAEHQDPSPLAQEQRFRLLDREFHAALAQLTQGLSPISLLDAWQDWALHLMISPGKQLELMVKGGEKWARLARFIHCSLMEGKAEPCITPLPQDRRFSHKSWQTFPFNLMSQSFLLTQQWWHNATAPNFGITSRHQRLVEFYSRQMLDVLAPTNFIGTNPEVLNTTLMTAGGNLAQGAIHLLEDFQRALTSQPPAGSEAYAPGVNVAVTPGEVIFRNELIELIQYYPATSRVAPEPILIVPPWIMKYYILDLSPKNSLIGYLIDQGFSVFCISWRNPGREQRDLSFDDYRTLGIMAAFDAIEASIPGQKIHATGYCIGGTLLAIAAAALARDNDARLASVSLFAAQIDFEEPGELGLFMDESQVSFLENLMWRQGYLDQRQMAGAFQMLRTRDLVWSRMIGEYLLGQRHEMTDLMAWNTDATRMPYKMHSQYLRHFFLDNELAEGRYKIDGRSVFIEDIEVPLFMVAATTDHVVPWHSMFTMIRLFDTSVTFVLTKGGHNAGIVSEPGHPHRFHRMLDHQRGDLHPDLDQWLADAEIRQGSWWPLWTAWLKQRSGPQAPPPPMGNAKAGFAPLYKAPGRYVLQR